MGLFPDTQNVDCACAGNAGNVFPRRRLQRKPLVSDPGMHHGTCFTHMPWCMSGSLTRGGGENVPGIPAACAPTILRIWQEAHYRKNESSYDKFDPQDQTAIVSEIKLFHWTILNSKMTSPKLQRNQEVSNIPTLCKHWFCNVGNRQKSNKAYHFSISQNETT